MMKNIFKPLYVLFLLVTILCPTHLSAYNQLRFSHIGAADGLPQQEIQWVFQDSRGFMWFCTGNGVSRYDGYRFQVYKHHPEDPNSPGHRYVGHMLEDLQGRLWFATYSSLDLYDEALETFKHFRTSNNVVSEVPAPIVYLCNIKNEPDKLWVGSVNGLEKFDKTTGEFKQDKFFTGYIKVLPKKIPMEMTEDEAGNLWFTMYQGIYKYDTVNKQIINYRHDPGDPDSIGSSNVNVLVKSNHEPGIFWVGHDRGLDRFDSVQQKFRHYRHERDNPSSLSHLGVRAICNSPSEPGILWVIAVNKSFGNGALNRLDTSTGQIRRYVHDPADPYSLSSAILSDVYQDPAGVLWVGTYSVGLNKASTGNTQFAHYYHDPIRRGSLSNNMVHAFSESPDEKGTMWIGTYSGLNKFDRDSGKFSFISLNNGNRRYTEPIIRALYQDKSDAGVIWIGSYNRGLFKYSIKTQEMTNYRRVLGNGNSLAMDRVFAIHESSAKPGVLWLGCAIMGIDEFNIEENSFRHHRLRKKNSRLPVSVLSIFEAPSQPGVLWLGTMLSGLARFDMNSGSVTYYLEQKDKKYNTRLITKVYGSVHFPNLLWLGTTSGLMKFDKTTGNARIVKFSDESEQNDLIESILEDNNGNLWIGSDNGLIRYNIKPRPGQSTALKRYDLRDGLQGNSFLAGAYKSADGEFYFGGSNGFNIFRPDNLKQNTQIPRVVITGFKLFNRTIKPGEPGPDGEPILSKSISRTSEIHLSYRHKLFSFTFAALDYTIPTKNRYSYKMEGFDQQWQDIGEKHSATFTGLPPGTYRFRVRGSNNDGVWNINDTAVRVVIHPPWSSTLWAYSLYAIILVLLVMALNRFQRVRLLQKERIRTEVSEAKLRAQAAEAQAQASEAENRRKTHEMDEARKLQLSMLPQQLPSPRGIDIGVFMRTATEVGGDYYDFYSADDSSLTAVIGDATGHGLKAGMMVSIMKTIFLTESPHLLEEKDYLQFYKGSNRTIKKMHLGNLFMGLTMIQLDLDSGNGFMTCAGMPPVFCFRNADRSVEEIFVKAPPLGAFGKITFTDKAITLNEGDSLFMFSDGLPELFSPEGDMFGYDRLKELFQSTAHLPPNEIISRLVDAADQWLKKKSQDDDITFVILTRSRSDTL